MGYWDFIKARLHWAMRDESGATTVDFVVGAAAGVGLAIAITNSIGGAAIDHSDRIEDKFVSQGIMTY